MLSLVAGHLNLKSHCTIPPMIAFLCSATGQQIAVIDIPGEPVCGLDFCDSCDDCMVCCAYYDCRPDQTAGHCRIVYEDQWPSFASEHPGAVIRAAD
jgi:hypothetical protein